MLSTTVERMEMLFTTRMRRMAEPEESHTGTGTELTLESNAGLRLCAYVSV